MGKNIPLSGSIAVCLGLIGIDHTLESIEFQSVFINAGAGPFFSHSILAAFGVIAGKILLDGNQIQRRSLLLIMGLCAGILLSQHSFKDLFGYPFGRKEFELVYLRASSGPEQIWKILSGETIKNSGKYYYNYRVGLAPMLMALCTGIYLFFRLFQPLTKFLQPLWSIGKHSLGVYLLHLIVMALIVVLTGSKRYFTSSLGIHGCFFAVTALCYLYAWYKARQKRNLTEME